MVRRKTKCLHFYFYYLDAEPGFIHIRLQSRFPFQIQVYVKGRECLARHLDQQKVAYERCDNSFTQIDDLPTAQAFREKSAHFEWSPVLNALAERVNPMLQTIQQAGFGSYYWVADQCEIATDLMFKDRTSLENILPDLFACPPARTSGRCGGLGQGTRRFALRLSGYFPFPRTQTAWQLQRQCFGRQQETSRRLACQVHHET